MEARACGTMENMLIKTHEKECRVVPCKPLFLWKKRIAQ